MKIKNYYKEKEYIHYSNCHEDILFVINNLKVKPKRVLSIASALDNSLSLLLLNPEKIIAIDSNPTQIFLCNLKKCAIKNLTYDEFLIFLGVKTGNGLELFNKIKDDLDGRTKEYFETHLYLIEDVKLVNCGRFEYYFQIFKNKILPLVHKKQTVKTFMESETQAEQSDFYFKKFNNLRFKLMFKLFFSEAVMKRLGRDKDYFKYNLESPEKMLKKKFENGILNNLNKENPYLQYVVLNKFKELPLYLKEENFNIIKDRLDRLEIKLCDFDAFIKEDNEFDLMYLSDIFEYLSEEQTAKLSNLIYERVAENGQVIYFNMLNERRLSAPFLEEKLNQDKDRAFYYSACYSYLKIKNDK